MPAPGVFREYDNSAAPIQAGQGNIKVVLLGESTDAASLNADNALPFIGADDALERIIGRRSSSLVAYETLEMIFDIGRAGAYFGRIIGTGGVKAQTAVINDIQGSPLPSIRGTWRGVGVNGDRFRLEVARGRLSTSDTGAGRVDTKLSLVEIATGRVVFTLDNLVMDANAENYAINTWNASGMPMVLTDQTPADSYDNLDEPAVGSYAFTTGADPIAATTTERQLAVDKLAAIAETQGARIGVYSWPAADVQYLMGKARDMSWKVVAHLADGTTSTAAATFSAAISSALERGFVTWGWGKPARYPTKRIPGIGQVLAMMIVGARRAAGLSVNDIGANEAVDAWVEFDPLLESDRQAFSNARVNPLRTKANRYQNGVVLGDVQSLSTDPRYDQIGKTAGEDLIVQDIVEWLEANVLLNQDYPIQAKVAGQNTDLTNASLSSIDLRIVELMTTRYPVTLFDRARGVGWDWRGDITTASSPDWVFGLGLDIAGVGRIAYVKVGRVQGRFAVIDRQQTIGGV
ncbi:MAG: hypothetical protein HC933_05020 [Pleurocapsa sp. SU_196_0]|nr:hypothetical protein [Pleurocapsa sp. SU_196_0]